MKSLVFLYNSVDLVKVRMIYDLAIEDRADTGLQPWMDKPLVRHRNAPTLGSGDDVDPQIKRAISEAEDVLYFIGDMGAGAYQGSTEAGAALEAVRARAMSDRPLRFLPVLLEGGQRASLPDWAQQRYILNLDRTLRTPAQIWAAITQRLASPENLDAEDAAAQMEPADAADSVAQRVADEISRDRPALTIFVGPYAYTAKGGEVGPAAMTKKLLSEIKISADQLLPILPWPSEAAQWTSLARGHRVVTELFRRQLASAGQNPPDLADKIGELAESWIKRTKERPKGKSDWHGLLLLTTRVDLAIESALSRDHQVHFTRILPTLNGVHGIVGADRKQLVQHWHPDPNWHPIPGEEVPADNAAKEKENQLQRFSLDEARRVILVKLCGSLDVQASLILTAYDFFQKASDLENLPKVLKEVIRNSPQVLLGRGFASPLAQLVRAYVLGRRQEHQTRVWVMPELVPPETEDDVLCQLELTLLKEDRAGFLEALDANQLHRGEQARFVRLLSKLI